MSGVRYLLALIVVFVPASSLAVSQIFPTEDGWVWTYGIQAGGSQVVEIRGTAMVRGRAVVVRDVVRDVDVQSAAGLSHYENYWSADDDAVELHGFTTFTGGFSRSFEPPILVIDPPLQIGKTWSTTTQAFEGLNGEVPSGDPITISFVVTESSLLDVPAGSFMAYKIESVSPTDPLQTLQTLLGALGQPSGLGAGGLPAAFEWYADGVGLVRGLSSLVGPYDLVSFSEPVSVSPSSWGAIKARYMDFIAD